MQLGDTSAIWLTGILASIGIIISNAEILSEWRELRRGGLYDWRILRLRRFLISKRFFAIIGDKLLGFPGILFVLVLRQGLAFSALVLLLLQEQTALVFWALFITSLLISLRHPLGAEGADHMLIIVCAAVAIAATFPTSAYIRNASLLFIAAQATISYFVSGLAKLPGDKWRKGTAVVEVLRTNTYGTPAVANLLSRNILVSKAITWSVLVFEIGFPVIYLLPDNLVMCVVGIAAAFHIACAFLMGLNLFVLAYSATFPSILYFALSGP